MAYADWKAKLLASIDALMVTWAIPCKCKCRVADVHSSSEGFSSASDASMEICRDLSKGQYGETLRKHRI